MAALDDADFTSTAEADDIIPTEHIQPFIEGMNLPMDVGIYLVDAAPGKGYTAHQFARWTTTMPDPVRAGGETDTVPRMEFATDSGSVTPVLRGIQLVIPDELVESQAEVIRQNQGVPAGMIMEAMRHIQDYRDEMILATATAATQIVGNAATVPSFAQFRTCVHSFKSLENDGQPVFVGNHYFYERLIEDFATANSSFATALMMTNPQVMSGGKSSYRGQVMGVDMWQSSNVAVAGGGASNFLMARGPGANRVIGYVNQRQIRIEYARPGSSTMQSRQAHQYTVTWADGAGLLRTDGLQECVMDAAA
jgi:hypothetical protein